MIDLNNFPETIRLLTDCWDTTEGHSLRVTLWSLWSWKEQPSVNLWVVMNDFSRKTRAEFCQLILMDMEARERLMRAIFQASGEWDRVDTRPVYIENNNNNAEVVP